MTSPDPVAKPFSQPARSGTGPPARAIPFRQSSAGLIRQAPSLIRTRSPVPALTVKQTVPPATFVSKNRLITINKWLRIVKLILCDRKILSPRKSVRSSAELSGPLRCVVLASVSGFRRSVNFCCQSRPSHVSCRRSRRRCKRASCAVDRPGSPRPARKNTG